MCEEDKDTEGATQKALVAAGIRFEDITGTIN